MRFSLRLKCERTIGTSLSHQHRSNAALGTHIDADWLLCRLSGATQHLVDVEHAQCAARLMQPDEQMGIERRSPAAQCCSQSVRCAAGQREKNGRAQSEGEEEQLVEERSASWTAQTATATASGQVRLEQRVERGARA